MPFLDEIGLKTFWDEIRKKLGSKIGVTNSATTTTIALKGRQATTDASTGKEIVSDIDIATGEIPAATSTSAGVMTADDRTKLDGIEDHATANKGTITGITTTAPLSGAGTEGSVALSHNKSGVTASTYGNLATTTVSPKFGGTFTVNGFTVNDTGHVTSAGAHSVTIPSSVAVASTDKSAGSAGLMSADDKKKLNNIAEGATANVGTITEVKTTSPLSGSGTAGSVTLSHAASGVEPNTYGFIETTPQKPNFGGTFRVPAFSVNESGHITGAHEHTVQVPDNVATHDATGLMDKTDKIKLDSIEDSAEVNQNAFASAVVGDTTIEADAKQDALNFAAGSNVTIKADAETDTITISSNNTTYGSATQTAAGLMSADDKKKIDGIESGAQKNTITGVKGSSETAYRTGQVSISPANIGLGNVNNTSDANKPISTATQAALDKKADSATTLAGYGITDAMTASAINDVIANAIAAAFTYKGTKTKIADLPSTSNKTGDVWHVNENAGEYAWNGTAWEELGSSIDLSSYLQSVTIAGTKLTPTNSTITVDALKTALGLTNVGNYNPGSAVTDIKRNGTTFTATKLDGSTFTFTQQDSNTWNALKGATASAAGTAGYVAAPSAGQQNYVLHGDATWRALPTSLPANGGTASNVSGTVAIAHGGTGATDASTARTNLGIVDMTGATSDADGKAGFVPAPKSGASNRYLRSDGTWVVPPNDNTKYSATTGTVGSASNWSAGSVPTLGTAIAADDITAWSAGSLPTLGTAIAADDITSWSGGTPTKVALVDGVIQITTGTAPALGYTARSIPNVTAVGSLPSLTYTARSIPNVTSVGKAPSLNITNTTVVTAVSAG